MKLISSKSTFFYKKVFPVVWVGILATVIVPAFTNSQRPTDPVFFIGPAMMLIIGYFVMKKFVWVLVDEVYDCGDYLLVRARGEEERIQLKNIMNVSLSANINPPQLSLRLVTPSPKFGSEVIFSPQTPFTLNPFKRNEIAEDLMVRVDKARSNRAV